MNGTLTLSPASLACLAIEATLDMSSYDELVHDPIRPAVSAGDHLFSWMKEENLESGVERSGVKGPLRWGSRSERFWKGRGGGRGRVEVRTEFKLVSTASRRRQNDGSTHDLDDLVVLGPLVSSEEALRSGLVGGFGDSGSTGRVEVRAHVGSVGEGRGGGANLSSHVGNGSET